MLMTNLIAYLLIISRAFCSLFSDRKNSTNLLEQPHKNLQDLEQEMDARLYEVMKLPHFSRIRERLAAKLHLNLTDDDELEGPPKFVFEIDSEVKTEKMHTSTESQGIGMDVQNLPMMYQGDLLLTNDQAEFVYRSKSREKRQAVKTGTDFPLNRWNPEVAISYYFDKSLSNKTQETIRAAIKFWEENSCMRFHEDGSLTPRVRFFKGPGCFSEIGKNLYAQDQQVSIGSSCNFFAPIAHEIGHVLGLIHTHSRYDRDAYVELRRANLPVDMASEFDKETRNGSSTLGVPYDYGSIMHYSGFNHLTGKVLMAAKDLRYEHTMGNSYGPVFSDLLVLNKFYSCGNNCLKIKSLDCQNQGFPHPKRCSECICPNGFGGLDCTKRASGEGGAPESCGQSVVASKENQTLRGVVTANAKGQLRQAGCHFHIQAPKGKRVEVVVDEVTGKCSVECIYGAVEVKFEDMARVGSRICCQPHLAELGSVISAGELVVVSVYSYKGSRSFTLTYRTVNAKDSTNSVLLNTFVENDGGKLQLDRLASTDCRDLSPNCMDNKGACEMDNFRENMHRLCQRTCGICNPNTDMTTNSTPSMGSPTEKTTVQGQFNESDNATSTTQSIGFGPEIWPWMYPNSQNQTDTVTETTATTPSVTVTTKSGPCAKEDHEKCPIWARGGICTFQFARENVQRKLCPHICGACE